MGHAKCRMRGARNQIWDLEPRIPNKNPTVLQLFLELLNLGFHLLPEGLLGCFLASVDEDRNHLLDSRDINAGTLGLTPLAIGDGPVDDLPFEIFFEAEKILARHLAERFLSAVLLTERGSRTRYQSSGDNTDDS